MRTDEVIVDQDPVQMPDQRSFTPGQGPEPALSLPKGAPGQRRHEFAKGEVEALDEGGLDLAAEAQGQERALPSSARSTANAGVEGLEPATAADLVELAEEQARIDNPDGRAPVRSTSSQSSRTAVKALPGPMTMSDAPTNVGSLQQRFELLAVFTLLVSSTLSHS